MPKCTICGKKFDTLSALKNHHDAVHPNTKFAAPKTSYTKNLYVGVIIAIIVIGSVVGYAAYLQIHGSSTTSSTTTCASTTTTTSLDAASLSPSIQLLAQDQSTEAVGQPITSTLYQELTSVSNSTLSGASTKGITLPNKVCAPSLQSDGKPLVFYVGGEFCPYCAAERWSMAVALSKFGTFSNITYMQSWSNEASGYQDLSTISFNYASYSSPYISFVPVEEYNQQDQQQHNLTSGEQALVNQYDSGKSIPFIDIANEYIVVGAQYGPPTLSGLTWDQIGAALNSTTNAVGSSINGAAITLITAICNADGDQPASVCGQSYATVNLAVAISPAGISQLSMMVNTMEPDRV